MRQLPLSVRLSDRARFDSYLAGPNTLALAALRAAAERPQPGLTWLCGPAASGKSHLLQALCAQAGAESVYLPLSQLRGLGAEALDDWQVGRWVCVDELAAVVGQQDWERALFRLYRACEERGAALLMAAREAPAELPFVLPDLASRCAAGHRLRLKGLDEAEQRAALRLRARQRGVELPEETALYLQRRLPRDLASLFSVLDELDLASLEAQRRLTVPFIRSALAQRPVAVK